MKFFHLAAFAVSISASAAGQTASPAESSPTQEEPLAIFRAALLREGSHIVEARARIQRDESRGWWGLILLETAADRPSQELLLLPCTQLTEMRRIVEASPNRAVEFQVTGRVFVYRNRNYVLPTHAAVVADQVRRTAPPDDQPKPLGTSEPGRDSADDIMRDLERAAGPLQRSQSQSLPPTWSESPRSSGAARPDKLMQEESSIVNRRGKIMRDSGGGWIFVFDADASGLADPPVRLLPCLLLERIEDYARRTGHNSPALLSGPVYVYSGQNYLLPTVFRVPSERRNLSP